MMNKNNSYARYEDGRRQFIKDISSIAGGALLLGTTPWLQSFTPERKKEIKGQKARIGMIGTGSRGQYHIQNLLLVPHCEIVALCDNYEPNLKDAAELCPTAKTYTDYRKMLESPDIDGVLISTPLNWHASMTLDSLAAGKHTFCEKSMALTMEECKTVYDTYQKTDKVLYFGMQRLYEEKYIKALQMIHSGIIGDIVGVRCHWFRNNDWRRPVPSPELERHINWRLYKASSGGLMTELATHQLEVSNWVLKRIPEAVTGFGDIVFWKDGREVNDSISLTYHYKNGIKTTYETLISNKFNGMGEQVLGHKGTMELAKGIYHFEEAKPAPGILQMINQIEHKIFDAVPIAGPSWVPETAQKQDAYYVMGNKAEVHSGASMIGAANDGSDILVSAFCQSCITGEKAENIVEECYLSTILCLMGNEAAASNSKVPFPENYKIPYLNF
ncbi:MAG: Gfo/Idh/MocA family protein [Niabella sp.]